MPTSFNLLSPQIQKYIWDAGWGELRQIQEASIKYITQTQDNYILSAATASGKTEAAFLPILSLCYPDGYQKDKGVKILYISPLIALINDQFKRVEELCKHLDIKVTKWHGEASQSEKKKLIQNPEGIVLITPESIEAMFCNKPQDIKKVFSEVAFVVIDEIHSFLGTDRGVHLQSLLYRLQELNTKPVRFVGLSATLGDYDLAKKFFGNPDKTKVLKDSKKNEIEVKFKFFNQETAELSQPTLDDLYQENLNSKTLIFPNSRSRVEEIAVKLKQKASREKSYHQYFAHHSSVEKESREWTENFAKTNQKDDFSIVCTSTLELGIDIGSIDKVIQVGSIMSVSSLSQRLGRSGRKTKKSKLTVYSLDQWQLLQNLACYELLQEGFLEPNQEIKRYDIIVQQILSILKQTSGIESGELISKLSKNWAFREITQNKIQKIMDHLIKLELIENLQRELILGIQSQYLVTSKDFYAVFEAKKGFQVINNGKTIGELDPPAFGKGSDYIGENVFLSAQIWKIIDVDDKKRKFFVERARDGKPPIFLDNGGREINPRIREKMLEIILNQRQFEYLDTKSQIELQDLRNQFQQFKGLNIENQRPAVEKNGKTDLYLFTGSRIQRTIQRIVDYTNKDLLSTPAETSISLTLKLDKITSLNYWKKLQSIEIDFDKISESILDQETSKNALTKYAKFLPFDLQLEFYQFLAFDIENYREFVRKIQPISK
jgi:ATP-dependent Lhr-like helicase